MVDPQQQKCANDRADPTGALASLIPTDGLTGIRRGNRKPNMIVSLAGYEARARL